MPNPPRLKLFACVVLISGMVAGGGPAMSAPVPTLAPVQDGMGMLANLVPGARGSGRVYALEQLTGRIRVLEHGQLLEFDFLDVGHRLIERPEAEEGLVGLALPPDGAPEAYVTYVGQAGDLILSRFEVASEGRSAVPESEQILLRIARDDRLHHCGHIAFGPRDGLLYLCVGDTQSDPMLNAVSQDPGSPLGKILRFDARTLAPAPHEGGPEGGPLAAMAAAAPAEPELWLSGLRNPWRFSFEPGSGDLFLPDVGRFHWEELNIVRSDASGGNHGWPLAEGYECLIDCAPRDDLVWPAFGYLHDGVQCSIIGGAHVPVGPGGEHHYVFGDFCSGHIWQLRRDGEQVQVRLIAETGLNPVAIVHAPDGRVLIADGPKGAIWHLDLPGEDAIAWQPAPRVVADQALQALRDGSTFTRELLEKERRDRESMGMSMRWQMTEPLVRLYDALGRPFD